MAQADMIRDAQTEGVVAKTVASAAEQFSKRLDERDEQRAARAEMEAARAKMEAAQAMSDSYAKTTKAPEEGSAAEVGMQ